MPATDTASYLQKTKYMIKNYEEYIKFDPLAPNTAWLKQTQSILEAFASNMQKTTSRKA